MLLLLLILFFTTVTLINSVSNRENIELYAQGYNYIANFTVSNNGNITLIIDTGNPNLTVLKTESNGVKIPKKDAIISALTNQVINGTCTALMEDYNTFILFGYYSGYVFRSEYECPLYNSDITIVGKTSSSSSSAIASNVNYTISSYITIDGNDVLHDWYGAKGDIGLAYSGNQPEELTAFQTVLMDVTGNSSSIFGLDLNSQTLSYVSASVLSTTSGSSMQLGYIKDEYYTDSIVWQKQPTQYPDYHNILIQNLQVCEHSIFNGYGSNWQTIIDTGSVCLTLPSQIYDSLIGWVDLSGKIDSVDELPSISFDVTDNNNVTSTVYIPLSVLLIDDDAIANGEVTPTVHIKNLSAQRLCIIKGASVAGSSSYASIVFGTMMLHALYFAGDYNKYSTAIHTKLSSSDIVEASSIVGKRCQAPVTCIGQQIYDSGTNTCLKPACVNYFFVKLEPSSQLCYYDPVPMTIGVIIIILIVLSETLCYFVFQYSSLELFGVTASYNMSSSTDDITNIRNDNNDRGGNRSLKIDVVSMVIGRFLTKLVDYGVHFLNWIPPVTHDHEA